jgi:ABC-type transporter Mla MlaB component
MDDLLGFETRRERDALVIHVRGDLSAEAAERFVDACQRLPRDIRRLRIDLHDVDRLDETSVSALRALTDWWRRERDGGARLHFTTAGVIAAYRKASIPSWRPAALDGDPRG